MGAIEANNSADLTDDCRPRLAAGVRLHTDRLTRDSVLLFPEALVKLQGSGAAIIPLCDGRRSFGEILSILGEQFKAPPAVLRADVTKYLLRLRERMLIEFDDVGGGETERVVPALPYDDRLAAKSRAPLAAGLPRPLGLIAELTYR